MGNVPLKSIDYILEHNIADCDILEELYHRIIGFTRDTNVSI